MNALHTHASVETTGPVPVLLESRDDLDVEPVVERPANATRSLFHIASALVSLALTLLLQPDHLLYTAATIAGTFWMLEALRRPFPRFNALLMRFFRPIAHASESHKVNSATWYMTALTGLALTHSQLLCLIGVTALGFGDPAASFIGRRFGRLELMRNRTLEGTLGFVVVGTATIAAVLMLATPRPSLAFALLLGFLAASAGAVAEVLSRRLDDNLTIPVAAAGVAAVVLALVGRFPWV